MSVIVTYLPKDVAAALDALGEQRGGKVVCVVVIVGDELELVYPGNVRAPTMRAIESMIVASILERDEL